MRPRGLPWELTPLLLSGFALGVLLLQPPAPFLWRLMPIGALVSMVVWLMAYQFSGTMEQRTSVRVTVHELEGQGALHSPTPLFSAGRLLLFLLAYVVSGALAGLFLAVAAHISTGFDFKWRAVAVLALGPAAVAISLFLAESLYAGLTNSFPWSDGEREWLARASSMHLRFAIEWALIVAVPTVGSYLIFQASHMELFPTVSYAVGTTLLGVVAAWLGKAKETAVQIKEGITTVREYSMSITLAILTPIAIFLVVSLCSALVDKIIFGDTIVNILATQVNRIDLPTYGSWLLYLSTAALFVGLLFSRTININDFSLHSTYRNRLIRAFLGATNTEGDPNLLTGQVTGRSPNPLTDFDGHDDILLSRLWPNKYPPKEGIPPQFQVVNATMNVVATKELAWQERKAMPFVLTPLHAGSSQADADRGAYRRVGVYGGGAQRFGTGAGMTLGSAMTISGAAASPNMGYHSSPAVSLLMTLFNVRLGAWKGNPGAAGNKAYWRKGPEWSFLPLIREALGLTSDDHPYVYLSDGGHFENLGLYEMIRRRCSLIIVSDAGCDPHCRFEDLGNALRKISIDLKTRIVFSDLAVRERIKAEKSTPAWAVAEIRYKDEASEPRALLLYIKPSFRGDEPAEVQAYALAHEDFPHESTANQWFGEAQFEAYRALGEHTIGQIARNIQCPTLRSFLEAVASSKPEERARDQAIV